MTSVDEESDLSNVTETVSLTVELPRDLVERLNALAARSQWDLSELVSEAVAERLSYLEWKLAAIEEAIADADSGAPGIPHEKVVAWMESWGKPDELPFPG
jgi:predicted transcriptional regulator